MYPHPYTDLYKWNLSLITPTKLKILSPYCIQLFVVYGACARKILVAQPIILCVSSLQSGDMLYLLLLNKVSTNAFIK